MFKKFIIITLLFSFFPFFALAAWPCLENYDETTFHTFHIVPPPSLCVNEPECTVCEHSFCDMFTMVQNILEFLMTIILVPLALFAVILAGALYLLGSMKPSWLSMAKQIWTSALIGFVVILCSWLIINTLVNNVFKWNKGENWAKLECNVEQ